MKDEQQRLTELEMKVAFQEDTINVLSDEIATLNEAIDRQRTQMTYLVSRLGDMNQEPQGNQAPEPPPPHY